MISQADNDLITYEQTLRYVEFPPLDMLPEEREIYKDDCPLQFQHTELFKILKWLREEKNVKTIIRLKASDRLVNCHDQRLMADGVKLFNVKVLDWKVLDLCLDIFDETCRENITDLCLYSSGNRAVISHWFSPTGFKSFKNVSSAHRVLPHFTLTCLRSSKPSRSISSRFILSLPGIQIVY